MAPVLTALPKAGSGVAGLDEITLGGYPAGRPTLLCGSAGCGKTLFALTFLVAGIRDYGEAGVFVTFEEDPGDVAANVASLGYDLPMLMERQQLVVDHVQLDRTEMAVAGEYDLEGLFVRIGYAIDRVGAKRVVLDTLEALFGGLDDEGLLRSELRRLFAWLKHRGVTTIITAERGNGTLTRHGLEEYVADCVILLDHRVQDKVTTRRLRVIKYRGSSHETNEYPFLIDERGISVLPVTSANLAHAVSDEMVASGIAGLDAMLEHAGFQRGSSILVSGLAGTGKTTFAACFADAACRRGERVLYFAFEEGPAQITRNMRSVGLALQNHVDAGLLQVIAARPTLYGFEMHLARMNRDLIEFEPHTVIIDPLTAFRGPPDEVHSVLLRLLDLLKTRGITAMFTSLADVDDRSDTIDRGLSSLMDAWLSLRDVEADGERNRVMYLLKVRGMAHSMQVREYRITSTGVALIDPYTGPGGVLTGSARLAQEAREQAAGRARVQEGLRRQREVARRRHVVEGEIASTMAALQAEEAEVAAMLEEQSEEQRISTGGHEAIAEQRATGSARVSQ